MDYDLLVRRGRVVDGSGLPSFIADVGVKDGKVAEVGKLKGTAARTIDADGLAVSPGFIDHHTHLDAQMLWDPYGTCEPQHGITTVVMGNCGLTLAPVKNGDEDAIVKSFVRVEAIPRFALEQGVKWNWHSYGEYLDNFEGKVGINVGGLVGHIAVRHNVMGEEAVERKATGEEVQQMRGLVLEAMEGGALGISTNRNERHMREDGKPVASRLADDEELFALCDVLAERNGGVIETILGRNKIEHFEFYHELAKRTQRPVLWQSLQHRWAEPNLWREQLDAVEPIFRAGYQAYGLSHTVPLVRHFTLKECQVFDEFPTWKNLMFLPVEVRKQAFADADTRQKLQGGSGRPAADQFPSPLGHSEGRESASSRKTKNTPARPLPSWRPCAVKSRWMPFWISSLEEDLGDGLLERQQRRRLERDGRDLAQPLRAGRHFGRRRPCAVRRRLRLRHDSVGPLGARAASDDAWSRRSTN